MGFIILDFLCIVLFLDVYSSQISPTYVPTLPPSFLPVPKNLTYNKGELAELKCAVANLGTKSVSWRKLPYITPIITGVKRFADDRRYQSRNIPYKDEWNLIIRNVQPVDAGIYECQVSAKERTLRQNITLTIRGSSSDKMVLHESIKLRHDGYRPHIETEIKPEISINGTKFVERGDRIFIKCNATGEEFPPDDIQWYKGGNKIKSDPRQKLIVKKEVKMRSRSLLSSLEIAHASMEDAGTYVCRTTSRELAISLTVNVLNGKRGPSVNVKRGSNGQSGIHDKSSKRTPNHTSKTETLGHASDNGVFWSSTSQVVAMLLIGHLVIQRYLLDLS